MRKLLFLSIFGLASAITYAGGYRVSVQGNRSLAMGHTGVAVISNAELGFHNPAGLIYLDSRFSLAAGVTPVFADVSWQNESTGEFYSTDNPMATPFYFNAAYKVKDWLSVGLSVTSPYGSTVEWPKDWAGSHLVNDIALQAIYIQPLASVRITDQLSVGGGPILVIGSVNFNRNLNRTLTDIDGNRANTTVDASGVTAWGWSLSAMYRATNKLNFGVNYRAEVIMEAEGGEAIFENVPNTPLAPFSNTTFDASLPMPAELTLGLSYQLNEKWLLAFDYNRAFWEVYKSLDLDFADPNIPDSKNPRNYKDANIWRFGAEYKATDKLALRAGYYYDETPVQDNYFAPETPRNDSQGFTAGLSLDISSKLALDASFAYIHFAEVDATYNPSTTEFPNYVGTPFSGTYKSNAFIGGIGVTYKL